MSDQLGVRVLGEFRLDGVDLGQLRSRKARTLLKVLALAGGAAVSADTLTDALWDDRLPADPASDLSVLVSRARAAVGADRVIRTDGGYSLRADWYDRVELDALTHEASRRLAAGDLAGGRAAAEAALALVRGPLLADEPESAWVTPLRTAAAAVVAQARLTAATASLAAGQSGDAASHARAALEHDPFDEVALRLLMRAHVAAGRPASALASYATMRGVLIEELGVSPSPETESLHESILLGTIVADPPPTDSWPATVLVGRGAQLNSLDEAQQRSLQRGEVVLVSGEAGIGKTSLLEAWATNARRRGVLVLSGHAEEGVGLALQPVVDALAMHVSGGAEIASVPDADRAVLEALLGSAIDREPVDRGRPTWGSLPGPAASADAMSLGMFAGLGRLLERLAPPSGMAVLIDDVHLADAVTLSWMSYVLRRRGEHRLMIVAAERDDEVGAVRASTSMKLAGLELDSIGELFGEEQAAALLQRTGGNPLLLVELASASDADDVPATILEAVAGRLRRAGAAAGTLRTAAVLGAAVDLDLLSGVLGCPPLEVLQHLDEGTRRAFLIERDGMMVFRHELVREAVAADTTATRRAWVHREAARILSLRADVNPIELAEHARRGGDRVLAANGLADAADIARDRFDLLGAEALLDEAIQLHDSAAARLRRSRVRMARADLSGADSDAEAALAKGGGSEALELRAWAARNRHDTEAAIRLGHAGAELATDAGTKASCLLAVAFAHRGVGDLPATETMLERARRLDPPPSLGLTAWFGVLRVHQGRPTEGLAALEPLLGVDNGRLQSFWVEHVLQMTVHGYGMTGRAADALAAIDRMEAEQRRRGSSARYAGMSQAYRSWVLRNLGEPQAEDVARSGIDRGVSNEIRAQAHLDLADTLLGIGRFDEAWDALEGAKAQYGFDSVHNRWRCEQRAGIIESRLHLVSGAPADAMESAQVVVAAAGGRSEARYSAIGRLMVVRSLARLGLAFDRAQMMTDLHALNELAGMEGWWIAADVADDTGMDEPRRVAERAGARLLEHTGNHRDSLLAAMRRRLS